MKQINYDYYEWLISQIDIPNGKSYNDLFEKMHNLEFVWTVPNDDNRVEDGLDLRIECLGTARKQLSLEGADVSRSLGCTQSKTCLHCWWRCTSMGLGLDQESALAQVVGSSYQRKR